MWMFKHRTRNLILETCSANLIESQKNSVFSGSSDFKSCK